MDFGCIIFLSFFSDKILISYCESQQSLVDLLTSSVFTLLSSPWWHLHLSPSYDVLNHTNHIFSESLSSGDDTDMVEMDMVDMDMVYMDIVDMDMVDMDMVIQGSSRVPV